MTPSDRERAGLRALELLLLLEDPQLGSRLYEDPFVAVLKITNRDKAVYLYAHNSRALEFSCRRWSGIWLEIQDHLTLREVRELAIRLTRTTV